VNDLIEIEDKKREKEIIEGLDHAFEFSLILITIISGTITQFVATDQQVDLPPIIANIRRLSIVFVFPSILTILTWVAIYFVDDETNKMRLRMFAWSTNIFLMMTAITELYVICLPPNSPQWVFIPLLIPVFGGMLLPFIPVVLIETIMNRYKTVLKDTDFFVKKGRFWWIKRYTPFALSYVSFWLSFLVSVSV